MPAKKPLVLEDIAEQITALGTMMGEQIHRLDVKVDSLDSKVDNLENKFDKLEAKVDNLDRRTGRIEQHLIQSDARLERIEGTLTAIESDIKELYTMVSQLRKDFDKHAVTDKSLISRLNKVEAVMQQVAKQNGIVFTPN